MRTLVNDSERRLTVVENDELRTLEWQVIQNANVYEEGFTEIWDGMRHGLCANRNAETEAPLEALLEPEAVKAIYLAGHLDPPKISPDS